MSGKYSKLGVHLQKTSNDKLVMMFEELEEVLGFPLPASARKHRPWWSNDEHHVQAKGGWLAAGWKVVTVDIFEKTVQFQKEVEKKNGNSPNISKEFSVGITDKITPKLFEDLSRQYFSEMFKKPLFPGQVDDVKKLFDFVSEDNSIVGDAKYYTMVRGKSLPPAKFSVIAEHVWLLESVNADRKFLVFGNDRRVPVEWLKRYGNLVKDVEFYFYDPKEDKLVDLMEEEE